MRHGKLWAAGAVAAVLACSAPAYAGYGAIAYDQKADRYGFAWNESTQQKASDLAKKDCGSDDCKLIPIAPRQCGALATAENHKESNAWGASMRPNKGDAEARAIADCQKHTKGQCKVRGAECNH
jgi:uncharacterized protein DUF4189